MHEHAFGRAADQRNAGTCGVCWLRSPHLEASDVSNLRHGAAGLLGPPGASPQAAPAEKCSGGEWSAAVAAADACRPRTVPQVHLFARKGQQTCVRHQREGERDVDHRQVKVSSSCRTWQPPSPPISEWSAPEATRGELSGRCARGARSYTGASNNELRISK